ncbi:mycothiol system anti-sigma-R factor [Corynebacterium hindlerae]|uniref:mycothiol system anti-sigma-R factor n=1 Tax=Corynebacterium hindlerae TaxID=699041 RepID=UPI0031B6721F
MTNSPNRRCECNCADAYSLLAELLDGECCETTRAELRSRIEACPHCFEKLGIEEEVREILRRSCAAQAPLRLRQQISVSIRVQRFS